MFILRTFSTIVAISLKGKIFGDKQEKVKCKIYLLISLLSR